MALAEHRRRRDIALLGLLDRQPHRLVVGDIAERPVSVDHGVVGRFLDDGPRRAGDDMPDLDALDIGRHLDDPVRIMADEVGADDVPHHERRLVLWRAGGDEQRAADLLEPVRLDFRHRFLPSVVVASVAKQSRSVMLPEGRTGLPSRAASSRRQGQFASARATATSVASVPGPPTIDSPTGSPSTALPGMRPAARRSARHGSTAV